MLVEYDLFEDEKNVLYSDKLTFQSNISRIEPFRLELQVLSCERRENINPKLLYSIGVHLKEATLTPKFARRAYGGSRVVFVSMARCNLSLDDGQYVERGRDRSASHCGAYMRECSGAPSKIKKLRPEISKSHLTPLQAAVSAVTISVLRHRPLRLLRVTHASHSPACRRFATASVQFPC